MNEHIVCTWEIAQLMEDARDKDAEIERLQDAGIKLVASHSAKDAEIERLKEDIKELRDIAVALAEAVQYCHVYRINQTTIDEQRALMQRARKLERRFLHETAEAVGDMKKIGSDTIGHLA